MRHFYGFQRKAKVIVPSDEEYKNRIAKRKEVDRDSIRESQLLEMKGKNPC